MLSKEGNKKSQRIIISWTHSVTCIVVYIGSLVMCERASSVISTVLMCCPALIFILSFELLHMTLDAAQDLARCQILEFLFFFYNKVARSCLVFIIIIFFKFWCSRIRLGTALAYSWLFFKMLFQNDFFQKTLKRHELNGNSCSDLLCELDM